MSARVKQTSGDVADFGDEASFRRRRNHAQIEAMTGLILQAVGYPTRRHRDFICALQSTNSGNDARVPYTPFRRAHLTLADLMMCEGTPDARRKAVYREIVTLRTFQRRKGLILFNVTSGSEDEATEYIDYLTPAADAAVQRMLSSRSGRRTSKRRSARPSPGPSSSSRAVTCRKRPTMMTRSRRSPSTRSKSGAGFWPRWSGRP